MSAQDDDLTGGTIPDDEQEPGTDAAPADAAPAFAPSPEDLAVDRRRRKANQARQRRFREKQHAAEKIALANLTTQIVWDRNRASLSDAELTNLEARQAAMLDIAGSMRTLIADLNLGKVPGETTYFVDILFEEAMAHQAETNPEHRLVVHVPPDEFTSLQNPDNKKVLDALSASDPVWWLYGYTTKIQTSLWHDFIDAIVKYFRANIGNEDIDQTLANAAIVEWYRIHPWRVSFEARHPLGFEHTNLTQAEVNEAQRLRVLGGYKIAESENERQRTKTQQDLLRLPPNFQY
jgi:hypothetical protein